MPSPSPLARALALAAAQHGLITAPQCRDAGLSRNAVQRLVRRGDWSRDAPGVYRVAGLPRTWPGRAWAAAISAGPTAVVSHRSAAHLWGLDGFGPTGRIELTVARHRRPRGRSGLVIHETTDTDLLAATRHLGVPVVGPARVLVDLAAVAAEPAEVVRALDEVLRLRLTGWPQLWATLDAHAHPGRPGIAAVRAALEQRWHGPAPAVSGAGRGAGGPASRGAPPPPAGRGVARVRRRR